MEAHCRVVGLGSRHGDDQAAWSVIERLQDREGVTAELVTLADPSLLVDCAIDVHRLILVDACVSGGTAGEVTRLVWPDPRIYAHHAQSSHGFGVAETLELAQQLGRLPREVIVFAIEIEDTLPGSAMSAAVTKGLDVLERELLQEIC